MTFSKERLQFDKVAPVLAVSTIGIYIIICIIIYLNSPSDSFRELRKNEKIAAIIEAIILWTVSVNRIIGEYIHPDTRNKSTSCVILSVHVVAALSNTIMASIECPVIIDKIIGTDQHLIRWAEYGVLAGTMTFLIESIETDSFKISAYRSIELSVTIIGCGILLPFINNKFIWFITLVTSLSICSQIYPRALIRMRSLSDDCNQSLFLNTSYFEKKLRIRIVNCLTNICCIMWSLFALSYAIAALTNIFFNNLNSEIPFIIDCIVDVTVKLLYGELIHRSNAWLPSCFENAEAELLKESNRVIWKYSSDAIIISHNDGEYDNSKILKAPKEISTIASEVISQILDDDVSKLWQKWCYHTCDKKEFYKGLVASGKKEKDYNSIKIGTPAKHFSSVISYILGYAIGCKTDSANLLITCTWYVLSNEIEEIDDNVSVEEEAPIPHWGKICEIRASLSEDNKCLIMIIRDDTDRTRMLEMKQDLAQSAATHEYLLRKKDEEVTSFTRHEVKNGVLDGMTMCDTIIEQLNENDTLSISHSVIELHSHLQNTLNTVLIEAMARELIYDTYQAQPERINIKELLQLSNSSRFSLIINPNPFPILLVDPRLLQHIHRNAISNACRYGKKMGKIETIVSYSKSKLLLKVINEPGIDQDKLIALSDPSIIFNRGVRVSRNSFSCNLTGKNLSQGDGGWIMRKCCQALGGQCSILFEKDKTVFSLEFPAITEIIDNSVIPDINNVWAIGIDDSALQRKLLSKMFEAIGVSHEKTLIIGSTHDEILNFTNITINKISQIGNNRIILIVDENLELEDSLYGRRTISGSSELVKIKSMLSPETMKNILFIVRSANDSKADCDMYNDRAHAFISKTGFNKLATREQIAAIWRKRFNLS